MGKWINEHLIPKILAFVNTKAVQSIKDGMVYTMPLLIVGSIFLILANLPVKQAADALAAAGITTILSQACGATFNISAIIAVIGISYAGRAVHPDACHCLRFAVFCTGNWPVSAVCRCHGAVGLPADHIRLPCWRLAQCTVTDCHLNYFLLRVYAVYPAA